MNADKRSVSTDALATLGTLIQGGERDAIHLAVEPIIAGESILPGSNIGISNGKAYYSGDGIKALGIADPFLQTTINPGERFWLIVYPRQITSLRHVWEHPDFETQVTIVRDKKVSEAWLRDFCEKSDCPGYDIVMAAVNGESIPEVEGYGTAYDIDPSGFFFSGRDAHGEIPPEFWYHVEIVTGKRPQYMPAYFSCSC